MYSARRECHLATKERREAAKMELERLDTVWKIRLLENIHKATQQCNTTAYGSNDPVIRAIFASYNGGDRVIRKNAIAIDSEKSHRLTIANVLNLSAQYVMKMPQNPIT